jgi:hypothetical protein
MTVSNTKPLYRFVPYGAIFEPEKTTLVLDVGMKTVPGIIDHHHPGAEPECAASLITKHPSLVLDHMQKGELSCIITHLRPDFDAVSSIFLTLKLLETGQVDSAMQKIAAYTKMVDSASLPKEWELPSTPYAILRALFLNIRERDDAADRKRVTEGLKFMNFLYDKINEGQDILQNRVLFSGIERYDRAIKKAENDYFEYLRDQERGQKLSLSLPRLSGSGRKSVDGLIVKNPRSYLLKDWARRDRINPPLKRGYSFLMTNFGNRRYIIGVDPEQEVHLKGLGDRLNREESEKRKEQNREFPSRWYDGNCPLFNFRIIDSPQDETSLSHPEIVAIIRGFGEH